MLGTTFFSYFHFVSGGYLLVFRKPPGGGPLVVARLTAGGNVDLESNVFEFPLHFSVEFILKLIIPYERGKN